ncbi:MAG: FKBP-type peptidyl-prolyl cis-trans isomerase [Myxococcota bacterium]|jgi:FKBP-type peptidyl-prolyl cis-trans isomerase 2|nr:FKBP-type peptidyl-prolyl cis-trans isomerase [Myxococcota bacterium]
MRVEEGKLVTLEYTITTTTGELIESSAGRGTTPKFAFGPSCGLPPGLISRIKGMAEDEEKEFDLPPEEAFGTEESAPMRELARNAFPSGVELKIGAMFQGDLPGTELSFKMKIVGKTGDKYLVRYLHPHAGKTLRIKAKVIKVEDLAN